jgi:ribosomal protein L11 methyltransferase
MAGSWMPYRIELDRAGSDTADCLIDLGALDVEIAAGGTTAVMPDRITPEEVRGATGARVVSCAPATGRDADSVWILRPRPIEVAGLRIVPAETEAGAGDIRLLDAPAFGTGLHPTTRLCLEALAELVQPPAPDAVLDVGTGSGVLALAALALGVRRATAIYLDADALETAAANARLNGLADRLTLAHARVEAVDGTWPIVLANVLAAPLIEMAPALARRVGHHGRVVLSGIPASVEADVERAYRWSGLRRVGAAARDGWIALVMQASW